MKAQLRTADKPAALAPPIASRVPGRTLQRKCACGGSPGPSGECEDCRKRRLQRKAVTAGGPAEIPSIVHDVLRSPGQPLDVSTRSFFEPRFGHDFSHVRVHSDTAAAESARAVNAYAYTVGSNIIFGADAYRPAQQEGRRLLAHELTHVVQQRHATANLQTLTIDGGEADPREQEAQRVSDTLSAGRRLTAPVTTSSPLIQRQPNLTDAAAGGCGVCYRGDLRKVGNDAHDMIQTEFELMYPALREFTLSIKGQKKPFIIQHGIPDLVLPTPTGLKIGEIKPANPEGYIEGDAKIEIYKRLAKERYGDRNPGFTVEPLDVAPPPPMPFVEPAAINCPQALITNPSVRGVYAYLCWPPFKQLVGKCKCTREPDRPPVPVDVREKKDVKEGEKKESKRRSSPQPSPIPALAAIAFALSVAGFALKKFAAKAGAKLAGGHAYAVASLLAVTYLLAARKADAKLGLGGDEPIVQLLRDLEQQGTPVPPEIRQMIENNPELKAKLEQNLKSGADVTAAQAEINEQILKILETNKSEFSQDEIELLIGATGAAGAGNLPRGEVTAATLRKMLDEKRGGGGGADKRNAWERAKEAPAAPKVNAWEKAKDTGGAAIEIERKYPGLSAETRGKLVGASAAVRRLFDAFASGVTGPRVTDAVVNQFLAIVPPDITDAQANTMGSRLAAANGQTIEQVLGTLKRAVQDVQESTSTDSTNARNSGAEAKAAPDASPGGAGRAPAAPRTPDRRIFESEAFKKVSPGTAVMTPGPTDPNKTIEVTIYGISSTGVKYVCTATVRLLDVKGRQLTLDVVSVSPIIDEKGDEHPGTRFLGRTSEWKRETK